MRYDFDTVHDRKNTNSLKYDFAVTRGNPADLLPLWVADMDFKVPFEVEEALVNCAKHGIFGYSEPLDGYYGAVQNWFAERFGYETKREWVVLTPGIVFAVTVAIQAFTETGGGVMIQRPVYYPFSEVILSNGRKLINNPLVYENGVYTIDFEDFERKITENNVKLFVLCSPHNPVGRVWTVGELERMGDICLKHGCLVLSDEIHCDFVYEPHFHRIFTTVKPEFADISIVCTAPSKTFNLAGLQCSNIFISNPELREKFVRAFDASGYSQLNTMGLVACESSYRYGGEWLAQLKEYLAGNIRLVADFAQSAGVNLVPTEGTYLAWLDFSPLNISDKELNGRILNKAGLWLDGGLMFGKEGSGFQRINIACPRSVLEQALNNLKKIF